MDKGNYAMILSAFHGSSKVLILEVHETRPRLLVIDDFDIVETSARLIFPFSISLIHEIIIIFIKN